MVLFPNAKINIGLNVVEKRADGFHNIETVFYPVGLSDILEINTWHKMIFKNTGLTVENRSFESNLCHKAYQLLQQDYSLDPVNMHLHKITPFGAGLGGGSSDASFTLKSLNHLFSLNLDQKTLIHYAERLGSDCPFFIINKPAYAEGKGENLEETDISLKGHYLVLIHPGIHINTAKAYSQITPTKPKTNIKELIRQPLEKWKESIQNDFEESVFKNHPELKAVKEELYALGAVYASMSGSGSAIYGIFNDKINLKSRFQDYFIWTQYL